MSDYVILTSKPGQFRTELSPGLVPVEAYDYVSQGKLRAQFVIAELQHETRLRVVDVAAAPILNLVPSKFLPRFANVEAARAELEHLTRFRGVQSSLIRQ
ncbi:ferredoxin [Sediminicoccus sp. KRV36]|uniref:ferredoxin n=1 Tax=Sediminicoccus sp. KRV36 TaxID=3133721 RepID=UPI00200D09E6|nr:ferredoxin [Sediminicoccus rosea]UPY38411.1 ferredoxin [Sediminicoccus rosea]